MKLEGSRCFIWESKLKERNLALKAWEKYHYEDPKTNGKAIHKQLSELQDHIEKQVITQHHITRK
jgi:hypothetical protein